MSTACGPRARLLVHSPAVALAAALWLATPARASVVTFDRSGMALVDGKPFFPVALFTYSLDGTVLAEMHELKFNTIIPLTENHKPEQLDTIRAHGLMAICPTGEAWVQRAKEDPALLAWYLDDEPEGHGLSPAQERDRYLALKARDPHHPIGIDHYLWEAIEKYKDACDFTMTDVYPITANRDVPITHVGKFMDEARRVHGPNWPHWTYIQVFGGPGTDGGKWAQPLPHEVRCMTYIALVHRAGGILYFPYWPKAERTWASLGPLNAEIHRMAPWLVADGKELPVTVSSPQVQARAKQVGRGGILLLVNTGPGFVDVDATVSGLRAARLEGLFEQRRPAVSGSRIRDCLGPLETRAYTWGPEPVVAMAGRQPGAQ